MRIFLRKTSFYILLNLAMIQAIGQEFEISKSTLGDGWASNSINTVIFRKNSLTTHDSTQFAAYYNQAGEMVIGLRNPDMPEWLLTNTGLTGNVKDAHNAISIAVDGMGFLHASWDHHNNPLNYARSQTPLSADFVRIDSMTGTLEQSVSYPQFYNLKNGNLLFMYRDGASGSGNLVIKKYDPKNEKWDDVQSNLLDGENQRNAYWQATIDNVGRIHLSWVWRETWDVATNHDLCYAYSDDDGTTWKKSNGDMYALPITQNSAEIVAKIPQDCELINQTSMSTDYMNNPYIASYWKQKNDVPQFHVVYLDESEWKTINTGFRSSDFSLSGGGTKKIPISRPQIIIDQSQKRTVHLLFRDEERGSKISFASSSYPYQTWSVHDLLDDNFDSWEPTLDTQHWKKKQQLHLLIQKVIQVDGEGLSDTPPTPVSVLEVSVSN